MISFGVVSLVCFLSSIHYSWGLHPAFPPSNHLDDTPENVRLLEDLDDLDLPLPLKTPPATRKSIIPIGNPYDMETDIPGQPLNPTDFTNSQAMDELSDSFLQDSNKIVQDPIEIAGLFEGDIIIDTPSDMPIFDSAGPIRNAINKDYKKWPNGVIPYIISGSYNNAERGTIAQAIGEFHKSTCIRFVPRTVEKDYIHIIKQSGCSSSVGRVGNGQAVSLGTGCLYRGIVMHELMHAAGFWHEQSRADRDSYIRIMYGNIQKGMDYNFEKFSWDTIQSLGVRYDPGSIMHYGAYAFAKDRSRPTIVSLNSNIKIGQRTGFSRTDIEKLKKLYNCAGVEPIITTTTTTTTPRPSPQTPAPVSQCVDDHQYCKAWAELGECDNNPEWMNLNCKKSCNQCGTSCKDESSNCDYWASKGECTRNAEYMSLFCKKSCGACHGGVVVSHCEDDNEHCSAWGRMGQCRVNPHYMLDHCKKSCRQC